MRRILTFFRHCEVLSAVETRISLLKMSIMRYANKDRCCFFPGKVLDEMENIYRSIQSNLSVEIRPYDILHELRDISSMAMEHFEENILPSLHTDPDLGNSSLPLEPGVFSFTETRGHVPTDELRAVTAFQRQRLNQLVQQSCQSSNSEDVCYQDSETTSSKDIQLNHSIICDVKRQAMYTSRINKLSRTVYHLLCGQRELIQKNRLLVSLINKQNQRIQHLETVCGISPTDRELEVESLSLPSSTPTICDSSSLTTTCGQSTMKCNSNNSSKCLGKRKRTDEDIINYSSNDDDDIHLGENNIQHVSPSKMPCPSEIE
ncbi:unnamed protein product [Trichobilharzia szidati]|nr:unnamed protein product [Trichobilharzia szidati]